MTSVEAGPVGVFGGTFDPVHFGHLRLAEEARECFALDRVLWIPAGRPPHRNPPVAAAEHRLAMVQLAVAGNGAFVPEAGELGTATPSFTFDTLTRLRSNLGAERPLVLLVGADAFRGLAEWHRWREIFALAHLGIATRPGHDVDADGLPAELEAELAARLVDRLPGTPAGSIARFSLTALEISATAIRKLLAAGDSPRYLIPERVLDYIDSHSLYR